MQASGNLRKRTVAAVAKECGVSPMTVSRALRENSLVKAETRRKIRATAERLGYFNNPNLGRPRATAPAPDSVDVVLGTKSGSQSLFYASLVMTLEHELRHRGLDCVVRRCAETYDGFIKLADSLRQSRARATLLLGEFDAEKLTSIMTLVPGALLLDNPGPPGLDIPYGYLAFDNAEAARLAVRHLVQNGRRRIALLTGPKSHYFSKEIETGYREELAARGLAPDADLVWECDFHADGARARTLQALATKTMFDAVFTSDELACGVLQALASQEIKVPAQVAVVGCDGLPVGCLVYPRLTTVVLDPEELGRLAVERILNPDATGRFSRTRLLPRLLVRDSSVSGDAVLPARIFCNAHH
jgi:DNA-binding LacI/PurR family transcriptional regulator